MSVLRAAGKRKKVQDERSTMESRTGRQGGADSRPGLGLAARGVARPGVERYARKEESQGRRQQQPWEVGLAGQRVPIRVPRFATSRGQRDPVAVLRGDAWRSCRGRPAVECCTGSPAATTRRAAAVPGAIGLSKVSRGFIQASAAQLRAFQEPEDVVAVFLDRWSSRWASRSRSASWRTRRTQRC